MSYIPFYIICVTTVTGYITHTSTPLYIICVNAFTGYNTHALYTIIHYMCNYCFWLHYTFPVRHTLLSVQARIQNGGQGVCHPGKITSSIGSIGINNWTPSPEKVGPPGKYFPHPCNLGKL